MSAGEAYIQIAELEIEPMHLESYSAALRAQIDAAIRLEEGVLTLQAVAAKDDPTHITVFEIYRDIDTYRAHLEAPHFKAYKATVEPMVKSLKLMQKVPVALGSKAG
ncbi:MAG TPA: antibiotic biosynthesis monooxygenase [Rhizobiaceae bacterium]|nr:antibiotic biosynthesis monooxygenase [Rhizobiaceae bacterium]